MDKTHGDISPQRTYRGHTKRCSTVLACREMRALYTYWDSFQNKQTKTSDTKYWHKRGEASSCVCCWWENVKRYSHSGKKLSIHLPFDPAIEFLDVDPREETHFTQEPVCDSSWHYYL